MRKLILRWLQADRFFKSLAGLATLVVLYLSLKPPSPDGESWNFIFIRGDLILHFICYFGLSILYFFAFFQSKNCVKKALILSFSIGFLLEFLQLAPLFHRFFDYQDLTANFLGAYGGIFTIRLLFLDSVK
jgi:VanZ family protein